MIKIGGRELLAAHSLLIPENEIGIVEINIAGWIISLEIAFDDSKAEQGIEIESRTNGAKITFVKWDNSIGSALIKPGNLGTLSDGRKLVFMASNYRIGRTNKIDIQLLAERGQ